MATQKRGRRLVPHAAQWSPLAKTWKEMAKSHQPSSSPKEINRSPAHLITNFRSTTAAPREFKIIKKGEGKRLSRKTPFFPPLLARCSRCWKEIFPRQRSDFQSHHNYSKRLVFFINQQINNMVPEKMVCSSTNQKQEKMKKAGPPHRLVVHGELPSGPQRTPSQDDLRRHQLQQQMMEKMRQSPKRPRGLPWPPKLVPTEIRNDERQASHFLCPLVMMDFITG